MEPILTKATYICTSTEDNLDDDSVIFFIIGYKSGGRGNPVAAHLSSSGHGGIAIGQTKEFPLEIVGTTLKEVLRNKRRSWIQLVSGTHDKWGFDYILVLEFSDGTKMNFTFKGARIGNHNGWSAHDELIMAS